jgi:hypothetical protein
VAKVKVINTQLNENLNGSYFNDTPSNTIFSFGKFFVTTNFDNKKTINYTNTLSSFVTPVTLDSLNINEIQSQILTEYNNNVVLNLDKSDLNTFVRFGSAYEFLRVSIQNIILNYPGSLFFNSQKFFQNSYNHKTVYGVSYDEINNITTLFPYVNVVDNVFGIVYNDNNTSLPDDKELKNLNISYENYVLWSISDPNSYYEIIGFTGNTINSVTYYEDSGLPQNSFLRVQVKGNPFGALGTGDSFYYDYHIRPNIVVFEEFRSLLNSYEKNIVSKRDNNEGFNFTLKDPILLEDGDIVYKDSLMVWATSDKYNIDINTPSYQKFLTIVLSIGTKYDKIKTDLIARFLTPSSLKAYDLTEEGKISKLLRIYGREFDQLRQFIDSLVNINKLSYDKVNNIPDQLIKNLATTFGWEYFSLINEEEFIETILTTDNNERSLTEETLPSEIDIELWRRIIINASYFWKTKGTRQALKSIFLLIGIPEPFINITEYVYTVDGKIDPNSVELNITDFPTNSLPYDNNGYPVAPLETSDFYFQISGNSDAGQAYLDVFRMAGFNLKQTEDNKKSWIQTGSTTRIHNTTPQYYQEDSKLVINTKEVDIALDTARGIEYDVYEYIKKDFIANSTGYTLQYSFVNISLDYTDNKNTFTLPSRYDKVQGDLEVRYNGILLNGPKFNENTLDLSRADYSATTNSFTLLNNNYAINSSDRRDVVEASFIYSGYTAVTGITVQYVVTRMNYINGAATILLPSAAKGDIQLTINGIALTKSTSQFVGDYSVDVNDNSLIYIQNQDVIKYLKQNPEIQVAYINVIGSDDINMRSEIFRVDSFNSSKIYFNASANKYVYKLNYKINNTSDVKFLIDGIGLEPSKDYSINIQNPYEIFLPKGIKYGSVISAYYLVGGEGAYDPVISDDFGLGDISQLSFLEFLELVQRKMVNVRTRKTVTDFKGGWYSSILRIYEVYLKKALLDENNPLQSNGYTFQNLYPFLSKYNAFFQRFVDQLLPATIILKKSGLLIRNSIFTKQKHWYKRGVNIPNPYDLSKDIRGNALLQYYGDDGSNFKIVQTGETFYVPPIECDIDFSYTISGQEFPSVPCASTLNLSLSADTPPILKIDYNLSSDIGSNYGYIEILLNNGIFKRILIQSDSNSSIEFSAYTGGTYAVKLYDYVSTSNCLLEKSIYSDVSIPFCMASAVVAQNGITTDRFGRIAGGTISVSDIYKTGLVEGKLIVRLYEWGYPSYRYIGGKTFEHGDIITDIVFDNEDIFMDNLYIVRLIDNSAIDECVVEYQVTITDQPSDATITATITSGVDNNIGWIKVANPLVTYNLGTTSNDVEIILLGANTNISIPNVYLNSDMEYTGEYNIPVYVPSNNSTEQFLITISAIHDTVENSITISNLPNDIFNVRVKDNVIGLFEISENRTIIGSWDIDSLVNHSTDVTANIVNLQLIEGDAVTYNNVTNINFQIIMSINYSDNGRYFGPYVLNEETFNGKQEVWYYPNIKTGGYTTDEIGTYIRMEYSQTDNKYIGSFQVRQNSNWYNNIYNNITPTVIEMSTSYDTISESPVNDVTNLYVEPIPANVTLLLKPH